VTGNIAERNSGTGIYAENTLTTTFASNTMLDNALFDARDDAFGSNPWTDNTCLTDNVSGAICGVD
jgi:parallel beta-helix repeat protein